MSQSHPTPGQPAARLPAEEPSTGPGMNTPAEEPSTGPGMNTPAEEPSTEPGMNTPVKARSEAPASGNTIGKYELIRSLGRGGMGEVHLARDLRLGRLVAIKVLLEPTASLGERFLAEARATARCTHENIVVIHEVGEDVAHGAHPYMVLEYLEGQTLRQWQAEHAARAAASRQPAGVPPGRAVELMLPVLRALAYAHERGIVHRDLKPENIMLTRSGTIKVLDFGLAKLLAAFEAGEGREPGAASPAIASAAASSSQLIGTLPYMSPEQMSVRAVDHRTDLWAVGIIFFELVTGRHPLPWKHAGDLLSIADAKVPMPSVRKRVPDIGPLGDVIDRCLIKNPARRPASARELVAELEALGQPREPAPARREGNPFAGLAAFQEADADRFFGRARDVDRVLAELRSRPLVAVVGPSGVGKSSLIRAGVIPAVKRSGEGWDTHVVRPGRQPLAALAAVLAQIHARPDDGPPALAPDTASDLLLSQLTARLRAEPGYLGVQLRAHASGTPRRGLLFVDQFEELYTLGVPADERAAFLACLSGVADDAASPLRVVLAMRSDFLDRMAEDRHFSAEVTRGMVLLGPLGRDGMRAALVRPLEATELRFESDALVERMIDALDATPGALPLLQFTAARLWELRDAERRLLTEASYEQLGGIAGALASHADAVLAGMSSAQQAVARTVLERLVTPERTRALVGMTELGELHRDPEVVHDVIRHLAAMWLVVVERGAKGESHIAELVHDFLIDRWPTLVRWLDENQEDAAFLARLRTAAQEWEKRGRDEGLLWRGAVAREAEVWRARYHGSLPAREQAYLDAVLGLAGRALRWRRRVTTGIIAAMALLLAGAVAALVLIWQAQGQAEEQAAIARQQAAERERALHEAEAARQEAGQQAQVAGDRAVERAEALHAAEQARQEAEAARREAEAARARAEQETVNAREALAQAQQSEARARKAEADALAALGRAQAAAEAERKARQALQALIDRSLGHVTRSLPAPAPAPRPAPKP